jgi:hypothetical protein
VIKVFLGLEQKEEVYQTLKRIIADELPMFRNHPMQSMILVQGYDIAVANDAVAMWDGLWLAEEVRGGFRTLDCKISPAIH